MTVTAQQRPAVPVIGYLGTTSSLDPGSAGNLPAFLASLREAGYIDGRNVVIEYRWMEGQVDRLPAFASELVALKVAVIVAANIWGAFAAQKLTQTIPIVFLAGRPVEAGLVASHARPGGNVTGVDIGLADLAPKRLELLRDLMPNASLVAYFLDPAGSHRVFERAEVERAARITGHDVRFVETRNGSEIEQAFERFAARRPDAILPGTSPLFHVERYRFIALAAQHKIPALYEWPDRAAAGGLISFGPSLVDALRMMGVYTARILAGAKPADLPVQRPTRFELAINLKTARTLGLIIPPAVLARADEVIE